MRIDENETLKEYRIRKGYSQSDMAKYIKVSDRQFRRYENKECALPMKEGTAYAKKLGLTVKKFIQLYYKEVE